MKDAVSALLFDQDDGALGPDSTWLSALYRCALVKLRCRGCGRGFNERTSSVLNRLQLPTDVVFLIVLWRLRMKLSLRDLTEILLLRGLVFSHEAIRDWEARLAPLLTDALRAALRPLDMPVLDHIIVAGGRSYSFAEHGHL